MTKPTTTDKYVKQALTKFDVKTSKYYHLNFPYKSGGDEFWEKLSEIDVKLTEKLAKRPITRQEIDGLCTRAFKVLRKFLVDHAATIEQPQFQEQVHIESGETILVPKDA